MTSERVKCPDGNTRVSGKEGKGACEGAMGGDYLKRTWYIGAGMKKESNQEKVLEVILRREREEKQLPRPEGGVEKNKCVLFLWLPVF